MMLHVDCFGEAIDLLRRKLNQRNVYAMNPAIDLKMRDRACCFLQQALYLRNGYGEGRAAAGGVGDGHMAAVDAGQLQGHAEPQAEVIRVGPAG